jgi:hypothetical protein
MYKIGIIQNNEEKALIYQNEYAKQKTTGPDRIIISTNGSYIDLAYGLISNISNKIGILYVLKVSRTNNEVGRYQLDHELDKYGLGKFLGKYHEYFELDGRHHIWMKSITSDDLIVYDNHNVLYVYGDLTHYIEELSSSGFMQVNNIEFPCPHAHHYNKVFDGTEKEIIQSNKWKFFPLKEDDDV